VPAPSLRLEVQPSLRARHPNMLADRTDKATGMDQIPRQRQPSQCTVVRARGQDGSAVAEMLAKVRAKERYAREQAEHAARLAAREAAGKTAATGKKPGPTVGVGGGRDRSHRPTSSLQKIPAPLRSLIHGCATALRALQLAHWDRGPSPLRQNGLSKSHVTSTSRTARCGPACRVVWEGRSKSCPLTRYAELIFRIPIL